MRITVKYFASLREQQGKDTEILSLPEARTVAEIWQQVSGQGVPENILMTVNMEYVKPHTRVKDGDEVAFFPPVTGG